MFNGMGSAFSDQTVPPIAPRFSPHCSAASSHPQVGPHGTVIYSVPALSPLPSPIQLTAMALPITGTQHLDARNSVKEQVLRAKTIEGRLERKNVSLVKSDPVHSKVKGGSLVNGSDIRQSMPSPASHAGTSRSGENQRQVGESTSRTLDESTMNIHSRASSESEL
ncbi:hypothetical protein PVL29_013398 [Vitis rotundifolia]|uniref:Uncharacterized protein n=1 Tax=Vitis rotundifolia TaxID=103349 RepID=A0AA38ZLB1_VITRO|nr:hypothetical protein PVL29_013398 [Vitis rotundifolia]